MALTPQRNYFMWFIIGICTFGLGFLIYFWMNFSDMKSHYEGYHLAGKKKGFPMTLSPMAAILIAICIPLIGGLFVFYKKHNDLYQHVAMEAKGPADPKPFSVLAALLISCCIPLGFLFVEYKWQEAMNYHLANY